MVAQTERWTMGKGNRSDVGETVGQSWSLVRRANRRGLDHLFEAIDTLIDLPWGDPRVHEAIANVAVERMRLKIY